MKRRFFSHSNLFFILCAFLVGALLANPARATYDDGGFFTGNRCEIKVNSDGWTLSNDAIERRLRLDGDGLTTAEVLKKPEMVQMATWLVSEAKFSVDGEGFDVSLGWEFVSSSIDTLPDCKQLTVVMKHKAKPFKVSLSYRVYPGTRFFMRKQMRLDLDQTRLISDVELDTLPTPRALWLSEQGLGWYFEGGDNCISIGHMIDGKPLAAAIFSGAPDDLNGKNVIFHDPVDADPGARYGITALWKGAIKRQSFELPPSISMYYTGVKQTAKLAFQIASAAVHTRSNPWTYPPAFTTWYATGPQTTEADCLQMIPTVASLGCKLFYVDDGWQQNVNNMGVYGDWLYSAARFPRGMAQVSSAAAQNGMSFGFWSTATQTPVSYVRHVNPRWAVLPTPSNAFAKDYMCLSTPWKDYMQARYLQLIRDNNARFLKIDFWLFLPDCNDDTHNHVLGRATAEQYESWKSMLETLRAARPDLIIDRAQSGQALSNLHELGWSNDWLVASRWDMPGKDDPETWRRSADLNRNEYWYLLNTQPSYTFLATAPAFIPEHANNMELLNYCIASVAALGANLEYSNSIAGITPEAIAVAKKWVDWNWEMRPWLTYTVGIKQAYNPKSASQLGSEPVDAYWHLRPALNRRYGFLVAFNPKETAQTFTTDLVPSDFMLTMDVTKLRVKKMNANVPFSFTTSNGVATFSMDMPPNSWQILELREPIPGDINGDDCVDDIDLFALTQDFLSTPNQHGQTDLNGDGKVDDFDLFVLTTHFLENCEN